MTTREQADARLRAALQAHADAYEMTPENALLGDYAVVVHWSPIEGDRDAPYTTHYHTARVPNHIAQGLFQVGLDIASGDWTNSDG